MQTVIFVDTRPSCKIVLTDDRENVHKSCAFQRVFQVWNLKCTKKHFSEDKKKYCACIKWWLFRSFLLASTFYYWGGGNCWKPKRIAFKEGKSSCCFRTRLEMQTIEEATNRVHSKEFEADQVYHRWHQGNKGKLTTSASTTNSTFESIINIASRIIFNVHLIWSYPNSQFVQIINVHCIVEKLFFKD